MAIKDSKDLMIIIAMIFIGQAVMTFGGVFLYKYLTTPKPKTEATEEKEKPAKGNPTPSEAQNQDFLKEYTVFADDNLKDIAVPPRNGKGQYLSCSIVFSHQTANANLGAELKAKAPIIRDALIDYFTAQDVNFLADVANREAIKTQVLNLVNGTLKEGEITGVSFTNFIVTPPEE